MSLQVWLPLNGDLHNLGLSNYNISMLRGSAIFNNNGKIGKCFYANGVNTIKIENIISDFYNYSGYSLCAWFYIEAQNTSHTGSAIISAGNWNNLVLNLALSDWSTDHYTRLLVSGTSWNKTYNYTFNKNTWYHVVVSSDGSKTYAYINGILIGDTQPGFLPTSIEGNNIAIGGATYYSGMLFFGKINDVRIYDHALSAKEVEEIAKGLVLHYKLDNNGLGNVNLALNSYQLDKASSKTNLYIYPRGAGTRLLRNDGFYEVKCTASWQGFSFWANALNLTVGTKLTYSFYIYGNGSSRAFSLYPMMFNSAGTRDTTTKLPISCDGENYVSANARAFTPTTATEPEFHYVTFEWSLGVADIISNGGSIELSILVHGTWNTGDWACVFAPKLEYGEVATRWSPAPVDLGLDTSIVYDCSGYKNNGQIVGTLTTTADTSKYEVSNIFDGNTSCVRFPFNSIVPHNIFTFNLWFKKDALGAKSYETLVGGLSGFEMDTRSGAATTLSLYMASKRGGNVFSPFSFGLWYMVTMVRDGTNELYYVNGELVKTITAQSMPTGLYWLGAWASDTGQNYYGKMSDFRIYTTPLTGAQIKELYNTSMSIDNEGNIHARELVEL